MMELLGRYANPAQRQLALDYPLLNAGAPSQVKKTDLCTLGIDYPVWIDDLEVRLDMQLLQQKMIPDLNASSSG